MNTLINFPSALIEFYSKNKVCTNVTYNNFQESYDAEECAYYPINFDFDRNLLLAECQAV
jgi:hypothetical protein